MLVELKADVGVEMAMVTGLWLTNSHSSLFKMPLYLVIRKQGQVRCILCSVVYVCLTDDLMCSLPASTAVIHIHKYAKIQLGLRGPERSLSNNTSQNLVMPPTADMKTKMKQKPSLKLKPSLKQKPGLEQKRNTARTYGQAIS